MDFPGGTVDRNLPANAGDTVPFLHAVEQLPACCNYPACVMQLLMPVCLETVLRNKRSHCKVKPAHCN